MAAIRAKLIVLGLLVVVGSAAIVCHFAWANAHDSATSSDPFGGPKVGEIAPDFTLTDLNGHPWTLSKQKGHPVTLAFFCGCDRCKAAAKEIAVLQRSGKLKSIVSIVALDKDGADLFRKQTGLGGAFLCDASDKVAERYSSEFCPRLWRMSTIQKIVYGSKVALEDVDLDEAIVYLTRNADQKVVAIQGDPRG